MTKPGLGAQQAAWFDTCTIWLCNEHYHEYVANSARYNSVTLYLPISMYADDACLLMNDPGKLQNALA